MPAWKSARNAGQSSLQNQIQQRSKLNDGAAWVGSYNFEDGKCFFCHARKGRQRTSYLPVTGAIWFCPDCADRVEPEKIFERSL